MYRLLASNTQSPLVIGTELNRQLALQKEKEQALQQSITHYVDQTALLGAEIQESLSDAIRQGLAASKKRKLPETAASVARVAAMDMAMDMAMTGCDMAMADDMVDWVMKRLVEGNTSYSLILHMPQSQSA